MTEREKKGIGAQERGNPLTQISLDTRCLSTTARALKGGYIAKQEIFHFITIWRKKELMHLFL